MEWLNTIFSPTVTLAMLIAAAMLKIFLLKRENRKISAQLNETTATLNLANKEVTNLQELQTETNDFKKNLNKAELAAQLQKSRTKLLASYDGNNAPGKYSYIHALIQKGLSAEEIGSILEISMHEARQLATLSVMAKSN